MELYHVDRDGTIEQFVGGEVKPYLMPNNTMSGLFPRLSKHGEKYFFESDAYLEIKHPESNNADTLAELIFELVRLKNFPDRISRFEASYAFKEYEDAYNFSQAKYPIYLINSDYYSLHDMKWLDTGDVPRGSSTQSYMSWRASGYWMREETENPVMEALMLGSFKVIKQL